MIRSALIAIGLLLAAGAGLSASEPVDETRPVAVPEPTPRAVSYARGNLGLWFLNRAWAIAVPAAILISGLSARLRDLAKRVGRRPTLTIVAFGFLYFGLTAVIDLPLDFFEGFLRQHAYGLSKKTADRWIVDWLKARGVEVGLGAALLWIPYLIIRRWPGRWWAGLALIWIPALLAVAFLKPIAYDPLFNRFGPMADRVLERDILRLAERAGIEGGRVFEVDKGRDTATVNAYVTGLLGSKRVVVWDTLTAKHPPREVLFVVGHEIGHYALNHVVSGLLVASILAMTGLAIVQVAAGRLLARSKGRWGFDRIGDVASLPLLFAVGQAVSIALTPIGYAWSRQMEHEADRFALEITRANHSGGSSFARLQAENLSLPRPDPFTRIVRSTHPPLADRIEFCNDYHPWRDGEPLVYDRLFRPAPAGLNGGNGGSPASPRRRLPTSSRRSGPTPGRNRGARPSARRGSRPSGRG